MSAQVDPFHAISISGLAQRLKAEGRSIIHMEFGQPSTGAPKAAIVAAHAVLDAEPMGYWSSDPLKARICRHYAEIYGVAVEPARITLTSGASPALVLALSATFRPGDVIAMARPGYVAYRNTVKALHMVPLEIACGAETRFQLTAAMLASLEPAPAGVILASPANPTGRITPRGDTTLIRPRTIETRFAMSSALSPPPRSQTASRRSCSISTPSSAASKRRSPRSASRSTRRALPASRSMPMLRAMATTLIS